MAANQRNQSLLIFGIHKYGCETDGRARLLQIRCHFTGAVLMIIADQHKFQPPGFGVSLFQNAQNALADCACTYQ